MKGGVFRLLTYVYRGRDIDGKYVYGTIESSGLSEAIQKLKGSHGLSIIFELKDCREAPYMERMEAFKESAGIFVNRALDYFKKELPRSFDNVRQSYRMSKVMGLVSRLSRFDIIRGNKEASVLDEPPASRPEFKKRPARRRDLSDGYAIAWDDIKGPERDAIRRLRLSSKDVQLFTRRLSLLLSSGVSIANALQIIQRRMTNMRLSQIVNMIYEDIQNGHPLSYALLRYPNQFSRLYVAMVVVGETSGTLDRCLLDMAEFMDTQQKITHSVKSATIYPRVVIVVLLLLLVAGAKFFVPMFEELFVDFEMPLPLMTRFIFWFAGSLLYILPVLLLLFLGMHLVLRFVPAIGDEYLYQRDKLVLRFPVIGELILSMSMFHFSHTLAVMVRNGVRLLDSLVMARDVVTNKVLQHEVNDALEQVVEGVNLSDALYSQCVFDPMVAGMVYTGEESGAMDSILSQTSEHYLLQVREQVDAFVQWIQPASVLLLAVVVVPVVLGIFLPLLDITSGGFMD